MNYTINTPSDYSLPTELLSFSDFEIVPFLLYRAAPTKTTSLSFDLENIIAGHVRRCLFDQFVGEDRESFIFSSNPNKQIERLAELGLTDQNLMCDRNKGFCWVRENPQDNDSSKAKQFDALLTHLRNSFAHGRTAGENDRLILEDQFGASSKSNYLSARLILDPSTLAEWIKAIERALKTEL